MQKIFKSRRSYMYVRFAAFVFLSVVSTSFPSFVDNRFLVPLLDRKPSIIDHSSVCPSCIWSIQPFVLAADQAYDALGEERGLFEYESPTYGIRFLDDALVLSGRTQAPLMRSDWRAVISEGPYHQEGLLQGKGLALDLFVPYWAHCGIGARTAFLQIDTASELVRNVERFEGIIQGPGDERELQLLQQQIHQKLGMASNCWSGFSMSDTDVYAKFFSIEDYSYKCRCIDAGLTVGAVIPTAYHHEIDNPASIACGDEGRWGLFGEATLDVILKQNFWFNFLCRVQKRFSKTSIERMPVDKEPQRYGALVGPVKVSPGWTFVLSPYLMFEGLRAGLGARLGYTMVKHWCDSWVDCRVDKKVNVQLGSVKSGSGWGSERVSCGVFYDLSKGRRHHALMPIVSLTVDIPVSWFATERSLRTFGVSLAVESYF